MNCRFVHIVLLLLALCLGSCEVEMPKDVIVQDKMEALLYDYHLVQAMSSEYASTEYKEKLYFDYVFKKHNVTKEQFEHSMKWYVRYPKHLKRIYANLEERLEKEVEVMGAAKGVIEDNTSLSVAYLATDTAELWTGPKNKMLTATPLNSKVAFGFDAPKDSAFVKGDSLFFAFTARFVPCGVKDVKQEAHAAIRIDYEDGSSDGRGVNILNSGDYVLSLKRNYGSRLKSMSGFVYYFDNDSTALPKLMLGDISLKRIHPVEKNKKKR